VVEGNEQQHSQREDLCMHGQTNQLQHEVNWTLTTRHAHGTISRAHTTVALTKTNQQKQRSLTRRRTSHWRVRINHV